MKNAAIILEFSNVCPFKHQYDFCCAYCSYTSPDFDLIRRHTSKEHKIRTLPVTGFDCFSLCKVDVTDLRCEICEETIKNVATLSEHLIEAHNKHIKRNVRSGVVPYLLNDGFACGDCGARFHVFRNLNTHMNIHYPYFVCSDCGQGFMNESRLKMHVKNNHYKPRKTIKCSKCGEKFLTYSNRLTHMVSKHNVFRHKCSYCAESFKSHKERVLHLNQQHNKNINNRCKMCPKSYSTSSNLFMHVRNFHMNERQYVCTVCGDMFYSVQILNSHMLKHTGEKNYVCKVCNKAFPRKKALAAHMPIHDDNRKLTVCVHCDKVFKHKYSLKGHIKTFHPNNVVGNTASSDDASETVLKVKPNKRKTKARRN